MDKIIQTCKKSQKTELRSELVDCQVRAICVTIKPRFESGHR